MGRIFSQRLNMRGESLVSCRRNPSTYCRRSIPGRGVAFARCTPPVRLAQAPCDPCASAAEFCQSISATGH